MDEPEIRRERRVSIELKYATIAILLAILFIVLHAADAFSGVNNTVKSGVDWLAGLGSIGLFFLALIANASIIIQIPYTLPLLSAALGGAGFVSMMFLGVASGLGAGIGAIAGLQGGRRRRGPESRPARRARLPLDRPERRSPTASHHVRDLRDCGIAAPRHHHRHAIGARSLRHAAGCAAALSREVRPQRAARAHLLHVRVVVSRARVGTGRCRGTAARSRSCSCCSSCTRPRSPAPAPPSVAADPRQVASPPSSSIWVTQANRGIPDSLPSFLTHGSLSAWMGIPPRFASSVPDSWVTQANGGYPDSLLLSS